MEYCAKIINNNYMLNRVSVFLRFISCAITWSITVDFYFIYTSVNSEIVNKPLFP